MLEHRTIFAAGGLSLSDVRCACPRSGWSSEETVETTRLVLPRRGVFEHRSRGVSTVADPNRLLWFHQDDPYRVRHPTDGGDRCSVIAVRRRELATIAESVGVAPERVPLLVEATIEPGLDEARRELDRLLGTVPDELELTEACLQLVALALATCAGRSSETARPGQRADRRRLAERARLALAERLDRSLTLTRLAGRLDCSSSHLCRVFRGETGLSLGRYRRRLRVRAAVERLDEGETDLTTLALDLGFYDHAHFTRTFREEMGMPPSRWRATRERHRR